MIERNGKVTAKRGRPSGAMTHRRRQVLGRPAKRREQMLSYVRDVFASEGFAPSYGMICKELGIRSREQVSRMVQAAERDGLLRRVGAGKVRRIQLAF